LKDEAARLKLEFRSDPKVLDGAIEELYLADVISVPSRYSAKSYQDPTLQSKLRLNSLGCTGRMKVPFARPRDAIRILMVGNNFLRKGTHYLIEAFRLMQDERARLKIRGDVPIEYAQRIHDPRIEILGAVTKSQLDSLYRWANVFCLPSIDEG